MLVSVIMPVYNSEKYVRKAIESILHQSETDIQVVLVDDGSTDRSGQICDQIACEDARVKVIHQKNAGICAARNAGLREAKGEYITFCDNDDEFLEGFIKDNYTLAKQYNADIVRFCRRRVVTKDGKIVRDSVMNRFPFAVIEKKDFPQFIDEITNTGNGVWNALYRRSFLEDNRIIFDESIRYGHEDTMFNIKAYQSFHRMVLNPKVYYIWKNRMEHSTTGKFNMNYIESMQKCMDEEIVLCRQYGESLLQSGKYHLRLAKAYIYPLYDYLNLAKDKLKIIEKRNVMQEFRKHKAFAVKNNYTAIKQEGLFFVALWTLFYYKLYLLPYCAIHVKQKLMNS